MQFGKTLVGAIIGAALGILLLVAVYLQFGIDKTWMAIPVALLTGLGVRMLAATSGNASYLRGAITVVLAMGAYLGGVAITKAVANHRAEKVTKAAPAHAAKEEPGEPGDAKGDAAPDAPAVVEPRMVPTNSDVSAHRPVMPNAGSSPWDFLSLAVAALVAYELGRGSGGVTGNAMDAGLGVPAPGSTHPDA